MDNQVVKLQKRFNAAKERRRNFDIMWQDITDYVLPYNDGFIVKKVEGENRMDKIFDSTALDAIEVAVAGIYSNSVNPSSRWLHLRVKDNELMKQYPVKQWLDTSSQLTQGYIDRLLAKPMIENFRDWLGYGMTAMFIKDEDDIYSPFSGTAYPLNDIYVGTDYRENIDAVFRTFELSYPQAEQMFAGKLPKDITNKYKNDENYKDTIKFLHCVCRNYKRDTTKDDPANMPWRSYYVCQDSFEVVDEGGFEENPYIVPRFSVVPGEIYGRGPMTKALPTVIALNQKVRNQIDASNMAIRPPMDVPEEAYLTPLRLTPGARNLNQDMQGRKATPINAVGDLNVTLNDIQEDRQNIRAMMYNDLLKLPLQDRMTTLEVDSRRQEQLALLAPFLVRLEQEYFDKIVERVVGILYRKGIIPPMPEGLTEETDIDIVYDSPLARSMKHSNVAAVDQTLQFILQLAQVSPQVLDNFDFDAIARGRAEDIGMPLSYMLDEQSIAKIRQTRAQQSKQTQDAMNTQQQLMAMENISKSVNQVGNTPGMEQLTTQLAQAITQGMAGAQEAQNTEQTQQLEELSV